MQKHTFQPVFRKNGCLSPPEVSVDRAYDLWMIRFICVPQAAMFPGHSPNSSGTATEKPLEAGASRGFSFWPKTDERPFPIALARRATMDAAFSDACVRILNVTGCAGQAEPARGMGARQAAISDSRRRGQTGSEILPALLKRLGLAPQYGRSAHALTSKRPGTPMVPGLSHGSCLAGF